MRRIILILSLLAGSTAGAWTELSSYPYTDTIDALPFTVSADSTLYRILADLDSDDSGIHINGANWFKIQGNGHTLTFDSSGNGCVYGLRIRNGASYGAIESLTVIQANTLTGATDTVHGQDVIGIIMSTCDHIRLRGVNCHVRGMSSMGFNAQDGQDAGAGCLGSDCEGTKTDIEIAGGNYTSYVHGFRNRMWNDAMVMEGKSNPIGTVDSFNFYVHGITIDSGCHALVGFASETRVEYCTLTVDAHNYYEDAYEGSWANAHALSGGELTAGSYFRYNKIRTGTAHSGGLLMYFDRCVGTAEDPVRIHNNDIAGSSGPTGEAQAARGIRMRWGNKYVYVYDNDIQIYGDDSAATDYRSPDGHGIWYTDMTDEGFYPRGCCQFYGNDVIMTWYGGDGPDGGPQNWAPIWLEQTRVDSLPAYNGNRIYSNSFASQHTTLWFGQLNTSCQGMSSYRDTFEYVAPHLTNTWGDHAAVWSGFYKGSGTWYDTGNVLIDPYFINFDPDSISGGANEAVYSDLFLMRSYRATVLSGGDPVTDATVTIIDGRGDTAATLTTPANGQVTDTVRVTGWYWYSKDLDSTVDYVGSGYTIIAASGEYADTSTVEFTYNLGGMATTVEDTLTLAGQAPTATKKVKGLKLRKGKI